MPQVQVLNHQPDPGAQMIQQGFQGLSDTLLQKQALALTREELKLKKQAADTDAAKLQSDKLLKAVDVMEKVKTGEMSGPAAGVALKSLMRGTGLSMSDLNEAYQVVSGNLNDLMSAMGPGPDEATAGQERGAKVQRNVAEAGQLNRISQILNQQLGDAQAGQPAQPPMPPDASGTAPGAPTTQPTSQARQAALAGGQPVGAPSGRGRAVIPQITMGGAQVTFPEAAAEVARAETIARESAKFDAELAPVKQTYDVYWDQLDRSLKEIGGTPETALAARIKGFAAGVSSEIGKLPETQAFTRMREFASLTIASFVNRGRPTEDDRAAVEKVMPGIQYPPATNAALNRLIQSALSNPLTGSAAYGGEEHLKAFIAEGESLIEENRRFVEWAIAQGASPEEINANLEELNAQRGY